MYEFAPKDVRAGWGVGRTGGRSKLIQTTEQKFDYKNGQNANTQATASTDSPCSGHHPLENFGMCACGFFGNFAACFSHIRALRGKTIEHDALAAVDIHIRFHFPSHGDVDGDGDDDDASANLFATWFCSVPQSLPPLVVSELSNISLAEKPQKLIDFLNCRLSGFWLVVFKETKVYTVKNNKIFNSKLFFFRHYN